MNPFEVERLGWDEIRGLPVVPDPEISTGRFRIVCSRESEDSSGRRPRRSASRSRSDRPHPREPPV